MFKIKTRTVLMKNGTKIRVLEKEADLIADFLFNITNEDSKYIRTFSGDKLITLLNCEEIVSIF